MLAGAGKLRLVVLGAAQRALGNDAGTEDRPRAVDVADEQLERAHSLGDAARELAPLLGGEQARNRIDPEVALAAGRAEADAAPADVARDGRTQLVELDVGDRVVQQRVGLGRRCAGR